MTEHKTRVVINITFDVDDNGIFNSKDTADKIQTEICKFLKSDEPAHYRISRLNISTLVGFAKHKQPDHECNFTLIDRYKN